MILLDHFIITISLSLVSYCSWSPTMLFVIQAGMSKVCITNMCSPILNSIDVYTIFHINSFHFPVECFLQSKTHCTLFILHWHHLLTLHHFHGCNSEIVSGRTVKLHKKVQEIVIEWVQFSSHCFLEKKWRHYFPAHPCIKVYAKMSHERLLTYWYWCNGWVISISTLYSGGPWFNSWLRGWLSWGFHRFTSSIQAMMLPSTSFLIHIPIFISSHVYMKLYILWTTHPCKNA
jgi:hypothetical protein